MKYTIQKLIFTNLVVLFGKVEVHKEDILSELVFSVFNSDSSVEVSGFPDLNFVIWNKLLVSILLIVNTFRQREGKDIVVPLINW